MYLVMTREKPTPLLELDIRMILNEGACANSYDGESTNTIKSRLLKETDPDCVIVTADSRLLYFVNDIFALDNVYVYDNGHFTKLKETTKRELRPAHNLMKLYEAGEFFRS